VVPAVSPTSGNTYSSSWVGIDGFNNSNLIQTGTEQDFVSGRARYAAWWEILPAPETPIASITVSPGDHMSASITSGSVLWTITITDTTTGQSFTTQEPYSGPGTSAEWIEEAPTVGGRVATLAHYGSTVLDPGTVNGAGPSLVSADGGVMVQHRAQVSTPSLPDGDTDGFAVQYGSVVPAAPAS
jgi:Peptidase A4 family